MAVHVARMRIGGSKVKTGCRTCKARRIKCDESRPMCQRCVKSGRACEGYLPSPSSTQPAIGHRFVHYIAPYQTTIPGPSPVPSQHTDLDLHALRSLDFFLKSTAVKLEQPFGLGLWSQAISCLVHSQPAIKHGLIALAAFHENYQHAARTPNAETRRVLALEHYGKSIREIVQLRLEDERKSLGPTLVASLLYCLIESLQGHFVSALRHIAAGLDLLIECERDPTIISCLPSTLLEALSQIFTSFGMQAMALESNVVMPVLIRYIDQSRFRRSCHFSTIEQALAEVAHIQIEGMRILEWVNLTRNDADHPCLSLAQAVHALRQRFDSWEITFDNLRTANVDLNNAGGYQTMLALLTLRINHHITKIILGVIFTVSQTAFDVLVDEFEEVVSCAEEIARVESECATEAGELYGPVFNMAVGIVPAIFYTCVRCRNHSIRHRALSYLRCTQRREALWDTGVVASLAEKVITIEEAAAAHHSSFAERGGPDHLSPNVKEVASSISDLPELERIERLEVDFLDSEKSAKVSLVNMGGTRTHQAMLVWDG